MYYARREAGVDHYTALRQLANRWVKVLCAMWRDDTLYDEQLHQQTAFSATRRGTGRMCAVHRFRSGLARHLTPRE